MGRDTREIWAKRVERWADSGLTAAEFASEAGVNPRTLTFWKWRLRSVKAPAAKKQPVVDRRPAFVELIGSSSGAADDSATLEIIRMRCMSPSLVGTAAERHRACHGEFTSMATASAGLEDQREAGRGLLRGPRVHGGASAALGVASRSDETA